MLVVYDNTGDVLFQSNDSVDPKEINAMNVAIPENQFVSKIDVSSDPHTPVFSNYRKTEYQQMEEENMAQQADIDYLLLLLGE